MTGNRAVNRGANKSEAEVVTQDVFQLIQQR